MRQFGRSDTSVARKRQEVKRIAMTARPDSDPTPDAVDPQSDDRSVAGRILWLYGLYMILHQTLFLVGYYWLPERVLRGSPWFRVGEWVAAGGTFSGQFARTLCTNVGVVCGLGVLLNLQRVKGFPLGYCVPIALGIVSGLILGTNSFAAMELDGIPFLAGTAHGLSVGGAEMLGYVMVIASTVNLGIYRRQTWTSWSEQFVRVGRLRDVRLRPGEWAALVAGLGLVILGAWRESS
jgi:hypothetical protein